MAVTVQMQFESAVTEMYQKAFVGSSIENGTTIIQFDLRKLDFQRALGTTSTICWRKDPYHVDIHELSTFQASLLRRDSRWPIAYSEELIFSIAATLQSMDRHHGIVGQKCCHSQGDSCLWQAEHSAPGGSNRAF